MLEREGGKLLGDDAGYRAVQAIPGVGPVLAAVFVAEIGDIGRFPAADKLCCWAGLTPRHRESDTTVRRGPITKQGSRLVRWAAIEAISRQAAGSFQWRGIDGSAYGRCQRRGSRSPTTSRVEST